jgi:hypothetical protein
VLMETATGGLRSADSMIACDLLVLACMMCCNVREYSRLSLKRWLNNSHDFRIYKPSFTKYLAPIREAESLGR